MFSVNTNLSAMAALSTLNNTQMMLQHTQQTIATGKKVSMSSDNPAIFDISNSMNADLSGLAAVSDNLSFGNATVSVATSAASQVSSALATLKNTVVQAQQQGIDPTVMGTQITAILANIDQFSKSATFNGVNLLDGTSPSLNVVQDMKGSQITVTNQNTTAAGLGLTGLGVNSTAMKMTFNNAFAVANADKVVLSDGTKSYTFEFSDGSAPLSSTPTSTNAVTAVQVNPGTQSNLQMIGNMVAAMKTAGFGAAVQSDGSVDIGGKGITNAASTSTFASGGASNTVLSGASAAISIVDAAIASMSTKTSSLGQAQQQITGMANFTSGLSSSLTAGLGALTDADMAAESAKLQSLQTKQSLAIQALSIANQGPQALMSLFR
jgi:flagellin